MYLPPRCKQVAILICKDMQNKEIATQLKLSLKTVEKHRAELYKHLGVHTTVALIKECLRNNIVEIEDFLS